jgi:hypothetical protein
MLTRRMVTWGHGCWTFQAWSRDDQQGCWRRAVHSWTGTEATACRRRRGREAAVLQGIHRLRLEARSKRMRQRKHNATENTSSV